MNILCIGDVIGSVGCDFLRRHLPTLKRLKGIDCVIVNGENSADTNGITPTSADHILTSGADCITGGNHSFQRKESASIYESDLPVLRPANYPPGVYGKGYYVLDFGRLSVCVISLMGLAYMGEPLDDPFRTVDAILKETRCKINIVDFHAESTAEKRCLAEHLKGRVSAVFGTHTHVMTADAQIIGGTGFITDVGMTGPVNSVIGCRVESALKKMTTHLPTRLDYASGDCMLNGVIFTVDDATGMTTAVEPVDIR